MIGDLEVTPRYQCGQPVERSTPVARLEEWQARMPVVTSDDDQFRALLDRSTQDLAGLRIFDPEFPDRAVVAAGAPWFMTLFGRDSLLTSWMTMLVDPDLALGTLQTLARFQGKEVDARTEEEPGRILHEMRFGETASLALGGGRVYYGTVDATPLFVMLVGELSRWGSRREEVDALLPAADAALRWITEFGDRDGDGYVEYQRTTDHGLQNQGWKDSWDSMRFADGSLAATPIALCEVQGYVYAALIARGHCATEAGDHELAASLTARAAELKRRFNEDFWVDTRRRRLLRARARPRQEADRRRRIEHGPLPLDRHRRRGEGAAGRAGAARPTACSAVGACARCRRRTRATTRSRTTAGASGRTTTRSCAAGLMRYGFADEAHRVMRGMVDASRWFGDLLPELFAGMPRDGLSFPVSYPTSCSPQAWAAASRLWHLWWRRVPTTRGAVVLLHEAARAGLDVVLASSADPDELNAMRRILDSDDRITAVVGAGDVDASKPEPDVLAVALDRVGAEPSDALFVGDSVWDGAAAQRLGLTFLGLLCGGTSATELTDSGAAATYGDPGDLATDLARWTAALEPVDTRAR